jgi:hypothetical protein
MSETKVKRGPKKSAADRLAELIASKRKEATKLGQKADALVDEQQHAQEACDQARAELKQLEAAHRALTGSAE